VSYEEGEQVEYDDPVALIRGNKQEYQRDADLRKSNDLPRDMSNHLS